MTLQAASGTGFCIHGLDSALFGGPVSNSRVWFRVKILVTGGAGFIGSAVIRHIISNTADSVVNVDKLTYAGNLESLAEVSQSSRYVFERVDICDREQIDRVMRCLLYTSDAADE